MTKILYVNACVRKESRTNRLAQFVLEKMAGEVSEVRLGDEQIMPLDDALLQERNELIAQNNFTHPSFKYAKQLAEADMLVVGAPYWDLSFPALLKSYLERINVQSLVFRYREDGSIQSLCHAKQLIYVTTAGGPIMEPNLGYEVVKRMAQSFWGISKFAYFKAEGLDIIGADVEKILQEAEDKI